MNDLHDTIRETLKTADEFAMLRAEESTKPLLMAIRMLADAISPEMREQIASALEEGVSNIDAPTANGSEQIRYAAAFIRGGQKTTG